MFAKVSHKMIGIRTTRSEENLALRLTPMKYSTSRMLQLEIESGADEGIVSMISVCTSEVKGLMSSPVKFTNSLINIIWLTLLWV